MLVMESKVRWLSEKATNIFKRKTDIRPVSAGLNKTANNDRFLRFVWGGYKRKYRT
jgi:hypothetical protein